MTAERVNHTLQPTALVHEAYLRLVGNADAPRWEGRAHFFAAAAEAMRRILIDDVRRRNRQRHGGGRQRVPLLSNTPETPRTDDDLLGVHEVVDQLAAHNPVAAELVKLHVFVGLTLEESAGLLGISARTGYRTWEYARAWMFRRLHNDSET
jgi:RNA polymerase sigma factor (TIGR02999 family)